MVNDKLLKAKGHADRPDLVGEHSFGDTGQIIFLIIFLIVWIVDSFFLHYSTSLVNSVPLYVRIPLALIFLSASGWLSKKGMGIVFGEVRETPVVIRKGPFAIVRHPVYLGVILFYLGLIALTLSIAATILWIGIIIFYRFISAHEEKLLCQMFGADYEEYMRDVPMLIPRLKRK